MDTMDGWEITKREAERQHAMSRARSRYGLDLRSEDIDRIVHEIKTGGARHLRKQSLRRSHWLWKEGETLMIAVYDQNREMVITFLELSMGHMPPDWYSGAWDRHVARRRPPELHGQARRNQKKLERSRSRAQAGFDQWLDRVHASA